jgi:hypothetical protein
LIFAGKIVPIEAAPLFWAVINHNGSFGVSGAANVPGADKIRYYPRSTYTAGMEKGIS